MFIAQACRPDLLVIPLLDGRERQVLARALFRDQPHDFHILVVIGNSPDYDGHINRLDNPLHHLGDFGGWPIVTVGISTLGLNYNGFSAIFRNAFPGPCRRIAQHPDEWRLGRLRPILRGVFVPDLHRHPRQTGCFALKGMEGVAGPPTDGYGVVPVTQGHFSDAARIDLFAGLKSQG